MMRPLSAPGLLSRRLAAIAAPLLKPHSQGRWRPVSAAIQSPTFDVSPDRLEGRATPIPAFSNQANRSEEHTSELQSLMRISYAVFCLKKKKINNKHNQHYTILQNTDKQTQH